MKSQMGSEAPQEGKENKRKGDKKRRWNPNIPPRQRQLVVCSMQEEDDQSQSIRARDVRSVLRILVPPFGGGLKTTRLRNLDCWCEQLSTTSCFFSPI